MYISLSTTNNSGPRMKSEHGTGTMMLLTAATIDIYTMAATPKQETSCTPQLMVCYELVTSSGLHKGDYASFTFHTKTLICLISLPLRGLL